MEKVVNKDRIKYPRMIFDKKSKRFFCPYCENQVKRNAHKCLNCHNKIKPLPIPIVIVSIIMSLLLIPIAISFTIISFTSTDSFYTLAWGLVGFAYCFYIGVMMIIFAWTNRYPIFLIPGIIDLIISMGCLVHGGII